MAGLVALVRERVEWALSVKGLEYPWWVAVLSSTTQVGCLLVALWQRDAFWPPQPVLLTLLVVPTCMVCGYHTATPRLARRHRFLIRYLWLIDGVPLVAAVLWLVLEPATRAPALDFAPAALAVLTLEIVAREGPRMGLAFGAASVVVAVIGAVLGDLPGIAVNLVELVLGFLLGLILDVQMRALRAERKARASEHERATQAERNRIAREIHDLVGHSLSVTLLHVTGARRSLAEDDDRAEALAALEDAESVSRRAMTEIRRSIGTLSNGSETAPLPTATDVPRLVDDVRRAGQPVELDMEQQVPEVDHALGLGIYRIVQESLSNVIKHAPGQTAHVSVRVRASRVQVDVRNPLPAPPTPATGEGTGIAGMAARADQLGGSLSAGSAGAEWRVRAELPLDAGPRTAPGATVTAEDGCIVTRIADTLTDPIPEVTPSPPRP